MSDALPPAPGWDEPLVDRRILPDRRARPTTFWSVFRPVGLRHDFRRCGERRNQYVDCPSRRAIALTIGIVLLSILDAYFTLLHVQDGGSEINPFMELALVLGVPVFVAAKTGLTNAGVIFLAIHENFRLGRAALQVTAVAYAALFAYHVALFLHG